MNTIASFKKDQVMHENAENLEELHSDAGKHELEQRGDDQDVADGADRHKHALHHILETDNNNDKLELSVPSNDKPSLARTLGAPELFAQQPVHELDQPISLLMSERF